MHLGSYFDPGMEFGKRFMRLNQHTKEELEEEFNRPFDGKGVRIIKSHTFCHHLDFLKETWPEVPVVLVHRPDDACLGWWVKCGEFNITYPCYQFYSNLEMMAMHIAQQNRDLLDFARKHNASFNILNNMDLAFKLGLHDPSDDYQQDYRKCDIRVAVV